MRAALGAGGYVRWELSFRTCMVSGLFEPHMPFLRLSIALGAASLVVHATWGHCSPVTTSAYDERLIFQSYFAKLFQAEVKPFASLISQQREALNHHRYDNIRSHDCLENIAIQY